MERLHLGPHRGHLRLHALLLLGRELRLERLQLLQLLLVLERAAQLPLADDGGDDLGDAVDVRLAQIRFPARLRFRLGLRLHGLQPLTRGGHGLRRAGVHQRPEALEPLQQRSVYVQHPPLIAHVRVELLLRHRVGARLQGGLAGSWGLLAHRSGGRAWNLLGFLAGREGYEHPQSPQHLAHARSSRRDMSAPRVCSGNLSGERLPAPVCHGGGAPATEQSPHYL